MDFSLLWVSSAYHTWTLGPGPSACVPWELAQKMQPPDTAGDSHMTMLTLPTTLPNWLKKIFFVKKSHKDKMTDIFLEEAEIQS